MPDCVVQGFVIGQTVGGCSLEILRIEIKHVNCITCVHQISETSDVPRMQQRSVEIRRSKCKSYVVLRGAILEQ